MSSPDSFDLVIIGAGPGGYVCAIRAAQLGMQVAIIEKRAGPKGVRLGGTCLNVGCIPSKALLDSSEHYHDAKHKFADHGVIVDPQMDIAKMLKRKDSVVDGLVGGVAFLMKKNKVTVLTGTGTLKSAGQVSVALADGSTQLLSAKNIVLAMGSVPIDLPFLPVDGTKIVTSDHAISLPAVPKRLVLVGGGVIGVELGSVWGRLGSQVTVLEFLPQILPGFDNDVAEALKKALGKQGMTFKTSVKVTGSKVTADGVSVQGHGFNADGSPGEAFSIDADVVLVAVGRKPVTANCGLEGAGVKLTARGRVQVDAHLQTTVPGVYALGDLIDGPMLAHKAEEEGVLIAEYLAGQKPHIDYNLIPGVVYTHPEVATVGMTEEAAKKLGRAYKIGKFPFAPIGRARAAGEADGFVKLITDPATDRLLGAAIVGPRASDLLTECVSVLEFGGSAEDIARTSHAHPSYSEATKEAALDALGRVMHG